MNPMRKSKVVLFIGLKKAGKSTVKNLLMGSPIPSETPYRETEESTLESFSITDCDMIVDIIDTSGLIRCFKASKYETRHEVLGINSNYRITTSFKSLNVPHVHFICICINSVDMNSDDI